MAKKPFIAKIDSLLAERGIAKKDFYRDCEITSATYSQWNTGKTKPRIYSLQKIADYLGVPFSEITVPFQENGETDQKEKSPTPEEAGLEYSDIQLLEAYKKADPITREAIQRILKLQ